MAQTMQRYEHYLQDALLTSEVTSSTDLGLYSITTTYMLWDYNVLEVRGTSNIATLTLTGGYTVLCTDAFLNSFPVDFSGIEALLQDNVVTEGLVYALGVNRPGRYYSKNTKVAKVAEMLYNGVDEKLHTPNIRVEDDTDVLVMHEYNAKLFMKLQQLGLPDNIAFKIMLTLSEVENADEYLDMFLQEGAAFPYSADTHLTLYEVYVCLAELLTVTVANSILEVYNSSMERSTRIWKMLRRGESVIYNPALKRDLEGLNSRAGSILLVMLERNMMHDYQTGSAVLEMLRAVDWDTMVVSVEQYLQRMHDNGLSKKIHQHFQTVPTEKAQKIFSESHGSIDAGSVQQDTQRYFSSGKHIRDYNSAMVQVDIPLIAHLVDDDMILRSIEALVDYAHEQQRHGNNYYVTKGSSKLPMSMLYTHLHWSLQGMDNLPMDWLLVPFADSGDTTKAVD